MIDLADYTSIANFRDNGGNCEREAWKAFAADPSKFGLVVTDQAMPKMVGTELVSLIHNLRKDIPVILCTGYQDPLSHEKAMQIGITEIVSKPLIKSEFAAAVRRTLDRENPAS